MTRRGARGARALAAVSLTGILLAVGAATLTVVPSLSPDLAHPAVVTDSVLWATGTGLGLVTALGFSAVLGRGQTNHSP